MEADEALTTLYLCHYAALVRMAGYLLSDRDGAEDVVQDAYVRVHARARRLADPALAVVYLRRTVVNLCHSRRRRLRLAARHVLTSEAAAPGPELAGVEAMEARRVLTALAALPRRQCEVLVLRYYLDLTEADIAHTLGVSPGAVKSHASRGLAALRLTLGENSEVDG